MVDNLPYVGRVEVAIQIIKADDGHKVKTGRTAAKQVEMPATIQIMKLIDVLLTVERVALGLKKHPQAAICFLYGNAAPVDRHIQHITGINIMINQRNRFAVILAEPFQQGTIPAKADMLNTEHRYCVWTKTLLNCRQHIIKTGGGDA